MCPLGPRQLGRNGYNLEELLLPKDFPSQEDLGQLTLNHGRLLRPVVVLVGRIQVATLRSGQRCRTNTPRHGRDSIRAPLQPSNSTCLSKCLLSNLPILQTISLAHLTTLRIPPLHTSNRRSLKRAPRRLRIKLPRHLIHSSFHSLRSTLHTLIKTLTITR